MPLDRVLGHSFDAPIGHADRRGRSCLRGGKSPTGRVASDLIERAVPEGGETRSGGVDPGGGVSDVAGREWRALERAGSAELESREGPPVFSSTPAERQVGEHAARWAAQEERGNRSISGIPAWRRS